VSAPIPVISGLPADGDGAWKRKQAGLQHQAFMGSVKNPPRYWGRSLIGWPLMRNASRMPLHHHISHCLKCSITVRWLVTQNVDRLHQKAGTSGGNRCTARADEVAIA